MFMSMLKNENRFDSFTLMRAFVVLQCSPPPCDSDVGKKRNTPWESVLRKPNSLFPRDAQFI